MLQPQLSLPRCRASEVSTFRTSDCEIPNSRAIRGGAIPALKAARTAFTWPPVSERTACAGRPLEGSFLFRDLGVGPSDAARLDGSLPRRFASSSAAARSDASSPSSSRLSALGKSFGNRYRRNDAAMSTAAAFGEETWLAGVGGGSGADASENRSGVGCCVRPRGMAASCCYRSDGARRGARPPTPRTHRKAPPGQGSYRAGKRCLREPCPAQRLLARRAKVPDRPSRGCFSKLAGDFRLSDGASCRPRLRPIN